jgi:hypothetical protein
METAESKGREEGDAPVAWEDALVDLIASESGRGHAGASLFPPFWQWIVSCGTSGVLHNMTVIADSGDSRRTCLQAASSIGETADVLVVEEECVMRTFGDTIEPFLRLSSRRAKSKKLVVLAGHMGNDFQLALRNKMNAWEPHAACWIVAPAVDKAYPIAPLLSRCVPVFASSGKPWEAQGDAGPESLLHAAVDPTVDAGTVDGLVSILSASHEDLCSEPVDSLVSALLDARPRVASLTID